MSWTLLLLLAAAAAILIMLFLKFRGDGRGDLTGPPKRKPRRLSRAELDRMTELVGRGGEAEVLRQLKAAGYDEAAARRLLWFMTRLAAED
ncbi:MAG TPA: hypothetical protein VEA60_02465 [Allosphingosinicella sp.]|nr:hypothetical protein [Allosphingosinicella sp.]